MRVEVVHANGLVAGELPTDVAGHVSFRQPTGEAVPETMKRATGFDSPRQSNVLWNPCLLHYTSEGRAVCRRRPQAHFRKESSFSITDQRLHRWSHRNANGSAVLLRLYGANDDVTAFDIAPLERQHIAHA